MAGSKLVKQRERAGCPPGWDLTGQICQGLAFASRAIRDATREVTAAHDLGPRGAWILNQIDNGIAYPRDLAVAFGIGRSLITAELTRLSAAGLISTTPGQSDRRRTALALTSSGREACLSIRERLAAIVSTNLAGYSAEQQRLFADMLRDARGGTEDEGIQQAATDCLR